MKQEAKEKNTEKVIEKTPAVKTYYKPKTKRMYERVNDAVDLYHIMTRHGDRIAFSYFDAARQVQDITYRDYAKMVLQFGAGLSKAGYEGKKVAIIVQGQDKNAISKILEGVRHTFKDSEIELRIFFTENKILNERRCLAACSSGFDALIIDGVKASTDSPNADIYEKLYKDNIPIIFYNNYHRDSKFPKVIVDDESCAQELVYQLVSNGHKYIGGLFIYDNYQGNKKYNGIIKSLIKYNVYVDDSYFKCCMLDDLRDSKQFKKMLWNFIKTIPKCTAIVCCNYMILEMLMEVLEIHNKQIPKDYSVVSFDYSADDWKQRNITTSIHPSFEMGVKLAQSVITMLENPSYNSQDVSYKFPPQIHIGASIKKIGPLP